MVVWAEVRRGGWGVVVLGGDDEDGEILEVRALGPFDFAVHHHRTRGDCWRSP